jgi:deferrochelatase/peroxidase EfeB
MPIERRGFLAGIATGALSVGIAACSRRTPPAPVDDHADPNPDGSFASSDHQPGVTSRPSSAAALVSLDLATTSRDQIVRLLQLLTSRARSSEEASSLRGGVTVTLAVGAGLFRAQLGLSELRPSRLIAMPRFPNDAPVPSWSHGDLLLQVGTQHPHTAQAELRRLLRSTGALLRPRWSIHGFRPENQMTGNLMTTRNLFGFREGAGNPDPGDQALMDRLVWVQPDSTFRRARLPGPRRQRPPGHGQPAQPRHRHPAPHGARNIAAALRRTARDATPVLPLLGITNS